MNTDMLFQKEYAYNYYKLDLVKTDTFKMEGLKPSAPFYNLKQTPDQCISFYNNESKSLIKICDDTTFKYPIFEDEEYKTLENYTWIDDSLILVNCNVISINGFHDKGIFVYNTQKQGKEITYHFKETGLSHSELDVYSPLFISGNFFKNYITINSTSFESVFLKKDSSLILPIKIFYLDTISHDTVLEARNKKNILVRVFNDNSEKRIEILDFTFADLYPKSISNGYLSQYMNALVGKQISDDEIVIGSSVSDRMIIYNFHIKTHRVIESNPIFEQPTGDRSVNDAIRGNQVDTNKHDWFRNIYKNTSLGLYFRPIQLGITPLYKSQYLDSRPIIQILDSNFNMIGIARNPTKQGFLGFDKVGNLLFFDFAKTKETGNVLINTYKLNSEYKSVNESLPCHSPQKLQPFAPAADIKDYVKEMVPNYKKYDNFVIIPIDNICPTCSDCIKCYLSKVQETDPKTAIIILLENKNSTKDFKHLENVFYDNQNAFMKHFRTDGYIPLFERKRNRFEFIKSFMPASPEDVTDFLNTEVSIFELGCYK